MSTELVLLNTELVHLSTELVPLSKELEIDKLVPLEVMDWR